MPAKSKAQQRYLAAKFGEAWLRAHHFDNPSKGLPNHVGKAKTDRRPRRQKKGR